MCFNLSKSKICNWVVGVDMSDKMINTAKEKLL